MIRLVRVAWLLLLLFVLGRQRWGAVAEERTGPHSVAHSLAHTGPHFVAHTGEHDSVQSEKLVHDDSTGKKLKEKDILSKKSHHSGTDALKLNHSLEGQEEEPNSNSRLADFPCPDAAAIAPCVCTVDADNNINLDCTFVESEEQLDNVFQQEFPVKELHGFYMTDNDAIRVLGNRHSGVSFETIDLYPGPFALQSISEYFLLDFRLSLRGLRIQDSNLLSDGFPFITLAAMGSLDSLIIRSSSFSWIPKLNSPAIQGLRFSSGSIDVIEPGTFDDVTSLGVLGLYNNSLTELRGGTVPLRERAMTFYGYYNDIEVIEPGTFFFIDAASAASSESLFVELTNNQVQSLRAGTFPLRNSRVYIDLYFNQIASIEPGTFVLPEVTDSFSLLLWLNENQLTIVDEAVFGDLMAFIPELGLYGNPLFCGCDIVWLVGSPELLAKIDPYATCADGTNLHDLDPQDFVDSCCRIDHILQENPFVSNLRVLVQQMWMSFLPQMHCENCLV